MAWIADVFPTLGANGLPARKAVGSVAQEEFGQERRACATGVPLKQRQQGLTLHRVGWIRVCESQHRRGKIKVESELIERGAWFNQFWITHEQWDPQRL